jgi:hypothetical protein
MNFKKIAAFFSALLSLGVVLSLPTNDTTNEVVHEDNIVYETPKDAYIDTPDSLIEGEEVADYGVTSVRIHYHNDDGLNIKRRFYVWVLGEKGVEVMPDNISDNGQDMDVTLDFNTDWQHFLHKDSLLFIIKFANTWSGQSEDLTLSYANFPPNESGHVEVWCIPGEGAAVEIYGSESETQFD